MAGVCGGAVNERLHATSTTTRDFKCLAVLQLAWLLFMQPMRLRALLRDWGLRFDGNAIAWWKAGQPARRLLMQMGAILVFGTESLALIGASVCGSIGIHVSWSHVVVGATVGVAIGVATESGPCNSATTFPLPRHHLFPSSRS